MYVDGNQVKITANMLKQDGDTSYVNIKAFSEMFGYTYTKGEYKKYIIITRSDITGDTFESLENYVDYMKDNDADSSLTTFLDNDAVLSTYELDGLYCQEILFPHNESFYAVALRGSTADEFNTLTNTIALQ